MSVDIVHELRDRCRPFADAGDDFVFATLAVVDVFAKFRARLFDCEAVAAVEPLRIMMLGEKTAKRRLIRAHRSAGRRDHDRSPPDDDVAGEKRVFLIEPEGKRIERVSRHVDCSQRRITGVDDVTFIERAIVRERCVRVCANGCTGNLREVRCAGIMVRVPVRDENLGDGPAVFTCRRGNGIEMRDDHRAGIDDDRTASGPHDIGIRSLERHRRRIRSKQYGNARTEPYHASSSSAGNANVVRSACVGSTVTIVFVRAKAKSSSSRENRDRRVRCLIVGKIIANVP